MLSGNDRGDEFTLFIAYWGAVPTTEVAEILAALDRAVAEYFRERGNDGVALTISDARVSSIKFWLGVAGVAVPAAKLEADYPGTTTQFLDLLKTGLTLSADATLPAYAKMFLGLCARPVAEGRAGEATIGSTQNDGAGIRIDQANAPIIVNNYYGNVIYRGGGVSQLGSTDKRDLDDTQGSESESERREGVDEMIRRSSELLDRTRERTRQNRLAPAKGLRGLIQRLTGQKPAAPVAAGQPQRWRLSIPRRVRRGVDTREPLMRIERKLCLRSSSRWMGIGTPASTRTLALFCPSSVVLASNRSKACRFADISSMSMMSEQYSNSSAKGSVKL